MASAHQEVVGASEPALCSKCKRMTAKGGSSIHSILAYSRCRCHRFLRYRNSRHSKIDLPPPAMVPVQTNESSVPPLISTAKATPQNSMILVSCSKNRLSSSQLVQVVQDLESQSKRKLVAVSTKECSVPLPAISHDLSKSHFKKRESSLSTTSVAKLPTISSQTVKHTKQHQHTSTIGKTPHGQGRVISEILKCIPMNKKRELKQHFKVLDKNDDGHLTLTEFFSAVHEYVSSCSGALDKLKQLYTMLSESTYFGYKEFIVCYSVAEELKSIQTVEGWSMERLLSLVKNTH